MKMKKISSVILAGLMLVAASCKESDFSDIYPDPSKISETTVEKQFTGFLQSNKDYVLPGYTHYFTMLRITLNQYNQSIGWVNGSGQYIPGSAGVENIWFNYYNLLAQYRELEKVYNSKSATDQADRKFFMTVAKIYLYDQTQRMVDVFGAIPFTEAGMLSTKGGDYVASAAKFDDPQVLYTLMLDDLKSIAAELNATTLNAGYLKSFQTQDFINKGDLTAWKRYCNSLRLRMLNRVSDVAAYQSRSNSEIAEILGNAGTYPIVETNDQNIQINVYSQNSPINSQGFQEGLGPGTWYGNTAGKKLIDYLNTNKDPRLRMLFEPGANAKGQYIGIDPMATAQAQTELSNAGQVAIYNRYVTNFNQFFPGIIINAPEVNLIKAEYYLRSGKDAAAKMAYEAAIGQSMDFYNRINDVSNAAQGVKPANVTPTEAIAYMAGNGVDWAKATTAAQKLELIAGQKWVHYNLVQPYENWADIRRLNLPTLSFWVDNNNNQTLPPVRLNYPGNEITYNPANYAAVRENDKLTTKIFWDVK